MLTDSQSKQRGDTLIEVLIAISILSLVVVTSQAIMNHGQSIAVRSVERTAAQADLNSQFSYIRYMRDEFLAGSDSPGGQAWTDIVTNYVRPESTNPVSAATCNESLSRPLSEPEMFFIDGQAALEATTDAGLVGAIEDYPIGGSGPAAANGAPQPGAGMWLLARRAGTGISYIDFYAKACWSSLSSPAMEQLKSVMRLYVP